MCLTEVLCVRERPPSRCELKLADVEIEYVSLFRICVSP